VPGSAGLEWQWIFRSRLFVVSYAPLAAIFAARMAPHWWWTAGFAALALWGLVDGWRLANGVRARSSYETVIERVEDQGNAVSGYLATYLLPFLGTLPAALGDIFAYVIYFLTALIIYAKSDLALINPTLYVLGWRVLKVAADGRSVLLLTRQDARQGDHVKVRRYPGDVLVADVGYGTLEE
jgi:small-conductance mechanosensitive channel